MTGVCCAFRGRIARFGVSGGSYLSSSLHDRKENSSGKNILHHLLLQRYPGSAPRSAPASTLEALPDGRMIKLKVGQQRVGGTHERPHLRTLFCIFSTQQTGRSIKGVLEQENRRWSAMISRYRPVSVAHLVPLMGAKQGLQTTDTMGTFSVTHT